jgi:hypothetical protein
MSRMPPTSHRNKLCPSSVKHLKGKEKQRKNTDCLNTPIDGNEEGEKVI